MRACNLYSKYDIRTRKRRFPRLSSKPNLPHHAILPYSLHKSCPSTSGPRFPLRQARRAIKVAVQTLPPILIWVRIEEAWESVAPIRLAVLHHGQLSQNPPVHK